MKTKSIFFIAASAFLMAVGLMSLGTISNPTLENSITSNGFVTDINEEGGPADIVISLKNDKHIYYINRGLEKGLNLEELNQKLIHHEITIYYAKKWTLLDPKGKKRHITRIVDNGAIVYDEIS